MTTLILLVLLCHFGTSTLADPSSACNSPECLPNSNIDFASLMNSVELSIRKASGNASFSMLYEEALIDGHSVDLSLNLLRHLYSPSRNLVFSPYSIVTALTMTLLGADGNSRRQLMVTLFGSENEHLVEQFITQHRDLTKYNADELQIGNFLYPNTSFPVKLEYSKKLIADFGAITKTVNISDEASAMETINSDVSEATHGMIPRLLTEIERDTVLMLINTVYFKGMWNIPFKEANTDLKGTFSKSPGGEEMQIPMMHHYKKDLPFSEQSDGTKCLLLPYNVPHMHLALLLPPEGIPIGTFVRNLTGAFLEPLLAERLSGFRRSVHVALPRFQISSTHSKLVQTMESLGVSDIFSPNQANLSKLTENWEQLFVDQVIQKATIEVNEEGTKATAATALRFVYQSGRSNEFDFIADRPFVYALLRAPGSPAQTQILFMGVVEDPRQE